MKVSIIIPAYNVESYIAETLLSIKNQNFSDYEIVVINDGSTDKTKTIVEKWQIEDKRIKLINQQNKGLSYARKVGLENANGEYIYFCDGDDLLAEGALTFMYNNAKKFSLDVLMINARYKNELNNSFGKKNADALVWRNDYPTHIISGQELLDLMLENREWRYAVWLYFAKKEVLNKIIFFERVIHEDSAHNYQMLNIAKRVKVLNYVSYIYRLREGSIMSNKTSIKNIDGYINAFNTIYDYNQKNFFGDEKKHKFEIRMLQQLMEAYNDLDQLEREDAKLMIINILTKIYSRDFYYQAEIQDFFSPLDPSIRKTNRLEVKDYVEALELHVVDHCNLNCANCCHFAPFAPTKFIDLIKYERDMKKLSEIIDGRLKRLVLMGGEPLLHPKIVEIIEITKKVFPKTDIQILTNGILLSSMKPNFWETCKKLDIQINVTMYPIKTDYKLIIKKFQQQGIKYYFYADGSKIKYFDKYCFDEKGLQCQKQNFYETCVMAKDCAYIEDGKIFPCQLASNIKFYNKKFKKHIPQNEKDFIDIYKVKDAQKIYEFLSKPIPFCGFCDFKKTKKVLWKQLKK